MNRQNYNTRMGGNGALLPTFDSDELLHQSYVTLDREAFTGTVRIVDGALYLDEIEPDALRALEKHIGQRATVVVVTKSDAKAE